MSAIPGQDLVLAWGRDALISHAKAVALEPILPAIGMAYQTKRGVERLSTGVKLMRGSNRPRDLIGADLFHGAVDRTRAISMISAGFQALVNDLVAWRQQQTESTPAVLATQQWLNADVAPTIDEWNTFAAEETKSWWKKIATSWETYTDWEIRLRQLRGLARAHGILLESSEPRPLPKTAFQKTEEGRASEGMAMIGVLKIGAAAVLTIMGTAGLVAVTKQLFSMRRKKG